MSNKKIITNLITVFVIIFIAKVIGFAREILYGSQLGITSISDNFIMAQTIPYTLYAIVTQAFRTTYIPNLAKISINEGNSACGKFTGNYIFIVGIISLFFFLFLIVFATPLTKIFAGGFSEENIAQTIYFSRIISVTILFSGIIDILNGYLQFYGFCNIGASLQIFSNIVFCIFILFYPHFGINSLLLGLILSKFTELIIILLGVFFHKLKISFSSWKYWSYVANALKNSSFVLAGSIISDVGNLIDKRFASSLASGTVSGLNYANKIQVMITQLFSTTISSVLFPQLSQYAADKNKYRHILDIGIQYIWMFLCPITFAIIILSKEIVEILFLRGEFGLDAAILTSQCLIYYAIGIIFIVGYEFLSKACFAIHKTKPPVIMSGIGMIINIIFNSLLITQFKHQGLAFATSLSMIIAFSGILFYLNKKYKFLKLNTIIEIMKIISSSILMGIVIFLCKQLPITNSYIFMGILIVLGITSYFIALFCLNSKSLHEFFTILKANKTK